MLVSSCLSSGIVHNCQCVTSLVLQCYTVSLLKDMSTHMTRLAHTYTCIQTNRSTSKHDTQTKKWKHQHSHTQTHRQHTHTYTEGPEKGWGWWQSLSVCQCQSLRRNEAEWHTLPSGDTQPVITKWHKWPTFPLASPYPSPSPSSKFEYLVLTSYSLLVSFAASFFFFFFW